MLVMSPERFPWLLARCRYRAPVSEEVSQSFSGTCGGRLRLSLILGPRPVQCGFPGSRVTSVILFLFKASILALVSGVFISLSFRFFFFKVSSVRILGLELTTPRSSVVRCND